jgi:hypothetical protein
MAKKIAKAKAGDRTNKLWAKVNEVIDALNPLLNLTVSPNGIADVKYSDGNVVIVLKTTDQCPSS